MKSPILFLAAAAVLFFLVFTHTGCAHSVQEINAEYRSIHSELPEVVIWPNDGSTRKDEAVIKLVVRAGSLQEDEDQLGYAHFVEHMAFRGTNKFPGDELSARMRELGINLGVHSNAYTTYDHTVYWLELNTSEPERIEAAIELLAQWAYYIEFDPAAVEQERSVIIEEWRIYEQESHRVNQRIFEELYAGSRHGERMPIGTRESIETVMPADLERFYRQWYHPGNMAVIVTGDIDEMQVRSWVEQYFSSPPYEFEEPRTPEVFPVHPAEIVPRLALTDEYTSTGYAELFWFFEHDPITTEEQRIESFKLDALLDILTDRLDDQLIGTQGTVSAFDYYYYEVSPGITVVSMYALLVQDEFASAVNMMVSELLGILEYGITERELNDWKRSMLRNWDAYQDRAADLAQAAADHVLYGRPLMNTPRESELMQAYFPLITSDSIIEYTAPVFSSQPYLWVIHPNNRPAPSAEEMDSWIAQAVYELQDAAADEDVFDWSIHSGYEGSILEEHALENEVLKFVLSNGMKVYYLHHTGTPGYVSFQMVGNGGLNLEDEPEVFSGRLLSETLMESGLRGVSGTRLSQWKSAEGISIDFDIDFYSRSFYGETPADEFSTAMRLLQVQLSEAKLDETVWGHVRQQYLNYLMQIEGHPHLAWVDAVNDALYGNDPALRMMTMEELEEVTLDDLNRFYLDHIYGAQNYVIAVAGDISDDEVREAINGSLTALPPSGFSSAPRQFPAADMSIARQVSGSGEQYALVQLSYQIEKNSLEGVEDLTVNAAQQWLDDTLFDEIRTRAGLVYYIDGEIDRGWLYDEAAQLSITLAVDPQRFEEAVILVEKTLAELVQNQPSARQVAVWQTTAIHDVRRQLAEASAAAARMAFASLQSSDAAAAAAPPIGEVTPEGVQRLLQKFSSKGARRIELVWLP